MAFSLPIKWYGTKYRKFSWIDSLIPYTDRWMDAFGGSGIVTSRRDPVPLEFYNDLNGNLANFFRVVRKHPEELQRTINNIPYSRDAVAAGCEKFDDPHITDIERAAWYFSVAEQTRAERTPETSSDVDWARSKSENRCQFHDTFVSRTEQFRELSERLKSVYIENTDALDLIEWFDNPSSTIYLDPPYTHESRGSEDNYDSEMTGEDHQDLVDTVSGSESFIAISGYANDIYDAGLSDWFTYSKTNKVNAGTESTEDRTEVLWTNYDADAIGGLVIGDWDDDSDMTLEEAREYHV